MPLHELAIFYNIEDEKVQEIVLYLERKDIVKIINRENTLG